MVFKNSWHYMPTIITLGLNRKSADRNYLLPALDIRIIPSQFLSVVLVLLVPALLFPYS